MARNSVQFQQGLSEAEFDRRYGTEAQCREVVIAARWPRGFQCPGWGIVDLTGLGRVLAESGRRATGLHHAAALWAYVSSCQILKAIARAERWVAAVVRWRRG